MYAKEERAHIYFGLEFDKHVPKPIRKWAHTHTHAYIFTIHCLPQIESIGKQQQRHISEMNTL